VHHVGILYDQFMMHGQRNIKSNEASLVSWLIGMVFKSLINFTVHWRCWGFICTVWYILLSSNSLHPGAFCQFTIHMMWELGLHILIRPLSVGGWIHTYKFPFLFFTYNGCVTVQKISDMFLEWCRMILI